MYLIMLDDEPQINQFVTLICEGIGVTVYTHTDTHKFMRDFRARPSFYDAAIIDLVLNNSSNGLHAATAIRDIRPNIPLLFLTSYDVAGGDAVQAQIRQLRAEYLKKPFYREQLIDKIGRLKRE